ncbi:MAG: sulfatase-like hydrolase/transferase, partial [Phycisphaerae bacterium]|nr:sulfatase-like hydrolase/transferase [Phycisphaerae bacterium]
MLKLKTFAVWLGWLACLTCAATANGAAAATPKSAKPAKSATTKPSKSPNIILFYADDLGHGDVGSYGCKDIQTPRIDSLASQGVRFTNYYSAAPICSPARAALLTGRYPSRTGVPNLVSSMPNSPGLLSSEITIAKLAKSRGYVTGLVGKWHLGSVAGSEPNDHGFDEFFGTHAGCIDYYSHIFYWPPEGEAPVHDLWRNRQEIFENGHYFTDLVAREAIQFIHTHGSQKADAPPFLLYVAFTAPHFPMMAPERYMKMYANVPDMPPERAIYAAMVTCMDDAIGQILDALQKAKLADDTLVFFASDNGATVEPEANFGGGSNAPFRGHKFSVFDGGSRSPAVVRWPGHVPSGQVRQQMVCAFDVFPTVAQAIGAELPTDRTIDGIAWQPIFNDANAAGHDVLVWQHVKQYAVRQGPWKLLVKAMDTRPHHLNIEVPKEDRVFLANVETDVGEQHNVAREHPEIVDRLNAIHDAWIKDVKYPVPVPTSAPTTNPASEPASNPASDAAM